MSAASWALTWVTAVADTNARLDAYDRALTEGRFDGITALELPVVRGPLPPALADEARSLHLRLADLVQRVQTVMDSTRDELDALPTTGPRPDKGNRPPAYVDARA